MWGQIGNLSAGWRKPTRSRIGLISFTTTPWDMCLSGSLKVGGRIANPEIGKQWPVKPAISRDEAVRLHLCMGANNKVGKDPGSLPSLLPVRTPRPAGKKQRIPTRSFHPKISSLSASREYRP